MKKNRSGGNNKQQHVSSEELRILNEILESGDPAGVAEAHNLKPEDLIRLKDKVLEQVSIEQLRIHRAKIGRNEPCPCGSGKKYKKCCLLKENQSPGEKLESDIAAAQQREKEIEEEVTRVWKQAMELYTASKYQQAITTISEALADHPHEDRLYDILQLCYLELNQPEKASDICRRRWLEAVKDKSFIREHGYQPRERDPRSPAKPGFPPVAWLSKYWRAYKAAEYRSESKKTVDETLASLIKKLKTADDPSIFPQTREQGLRVRMEALEETAKQIASFGDKALPYLKPYSYRYGWTCMMIPTILRKIDSKAARSLLMDMIMFQIPYASESSMKLLEQYGEPVITEVIDRFTQEKEFDPIKTGLISVIARIHSEATFQFLLSLLNHPDSHVVNWTAGALAQYGDSRALPKMKAARRRVGSEPRLDWGIDQLENQKRE